MARWKKTNLRQMFPMLLLLLMLLLMLLLFVAADVCS